LTDLAIQIWSYPILDNSKLEKYKMNRRTRPNPTYTEEDHLKNSDDNTDRLYYSLKNKILHLGNDITINSVRYYIGFARNNNFTAIRFRRSYLLVDLIINEGFQDPKGISIQANKHKYGGRVRSVRVGSDSIIDDLMFLVKQTYEKS
jgi:predicted transport protein